MLLNGAQVTTPATRQVVAGSAEHSVGRDPAAVAEHHAPVLLVVRRPGAHADDHMPASGAAYHASFAPLTPGTQR